MQGVRRNHIFSWTGDGTSEIVESVHDKMVNWISHGISHKDLSRHRFISILEGHSTGETSLSDMLTQSKLIEQEPEEFGPGRVRFKTGDDLPKIIEEIPPFEDDDMSSRRLSDFDTPSASEELALFLRSEETLKRSIGFQLRHSAYEHLNEDELYFSLVTDECQEESSSSTNHHPGSTTQPPSSDTQCFEDDKWYYYEDETWFMLDESELEGSTVYPVDRATRPITPQELKDRYPEIREARVKELKSWIDNHTGHAEKKAVWEKQTGRRAIPSRWVDCWKFKNGQLIAKSRLLEGIC
jgi:hypothetical protein